MPELQTFILIVAGLLLFIWGKRNMYHIQKKEAEKVMLMYQREEDRKEKEEKLKNAGVLFSFEEAKRRKRK